MDPKYDAEIEYLRMLSSAKIVANSYFLNGRAMRRLPLNTKSTDDSILSLAWLSSDGTSLLVPITAPKRYGNFKVKMILDMSKYGFEGEEYDKFTVT